MSSQTLARPKKAVARKSKSKRKKTRGWIAWWPLLAGVVITLGAVKTAEILPLMGPGGLLRLQLLYPFPLLLKLPLLGLGDSAGELCSQILLYTQYPLYGVYASIVTRWKPLWAVVLHLTIFHLLGFAALWLLAHN
jgi:hypothetical protein